MKKLIRNLLLPLSPFLIMILINEMVRPTIKEEPFELHGIETMNSDIISTEKCSWHCYRETTTHCKIHHVKLLHNYFDHIDPIYFGIINSLHSTGSYGLANVIILVLLLPFLIYLLLIKNMNMYHQIKKLKSNA